MNNSTQKIIPHLWFDHQAEEAARFYTSLFENSSVGVITHYTEEGQDVHGQSAGQVMIVEFELDGFRFIGLNGGPHFSFTPAISFFVVCESDEEIQRLWDELVAGGAAMMPLDTYDWSEKYGWVQDRYGLTWQLSLGDLYEVGQKITPAFLFVGDQHGRAEEAMNVYTSLFDDSEIADILRYEAGEQDPEGTVKHAQFSLSGEQFMAMDSSFAHAFTFNEAISLLIMCDSQEEVDYFWEELTDGGDPGAQQCGWLKDRFGVSWQVFPTELRDMMLDSDTEKVKRVTRAFLQMKKLDVDALQHAYES